MTAENDIDESIINFIENQKIATLCCIDDENHPFCFNCFYTFDAAKGLLYFKSAATSYHVGLILKKPQVAGTILPDKLNVLAIKGLQFSGIVLQPDHLLSKNAARKYHLRFPFALAIPGEVYTISLAKMKMTDNSKGFGKKTVWENNQINAYHHQ